MDGNVSSQNLSRRTAHAPVETAVRVLLALAVRLDEVERGGKVGDDDNLLVGRLAQFGEHGGEEEELACEHASLAGPACH